MNATELQKENKRLKELLQEARQQHAAEVEQFGKAIEEKQRSISQL